MATASKFEAILTDVSNLKKKLRVLVEAPFEGGPLFINPECMGDCVSNKGNGYPIALHFYEGKLLLLVWADINQEDPTHTIDLSGALETNRKELIKT